MDSFFYAERFRDIKSILVMLAALELMLWVAIVWMFGITGPSFILITVTTLKIVLIQHYAMYCEFYEYELRGAVTGHPHR